MGDNMHGLGPEKGAGGKQERGGGFTPKLIYSPARAAQRREHAAKVAAKRKNRNKAAKKARRVNRT